MDNTTVETNQKEASPSPKPEETVEPVAMGGESHSGKCGCDQPAAARSRSSREEKIRKKDDKSVEHVLKALNSLNTTEEKLAAMCKKYADIFDENRKLQLALKQAEKRCSILQREKEQFQAEHSKAILTRSRLENLCREFQRQNKAIKDESLLKIREEEEKRKEVSAKFQSTLTEITTLMQQNNDKNIKLRDDNIDMNTKLKNVCEQYEIREQEVEKISKQMQLEAQLADAKLAKAKIEMSAEREILLREKQQLLVEMSQYQARCQEFSNTETNLRNQISLYDEKYDEFQKALARSNEVFGGFKGEMEKMSKKICKLEKETMTWKQRWEGSHRALLEMADDKQRADKELGLATRQMVALQRLCRTLQTERSTLLVKLKEGSDKGENNVQEPDQLDIEGEPLLNGEVINTGDEQNISFNCETSFNNSTSRSQVCCNKQQTNDQHITNCQFENKAKKDKVPHSNKEVTSDKTVVQNGLSKTGSGDTCALQTTTIADKEVESNECSVQNIVNSGSGSLVESKPVLPTGKGNVPPSPATDSLANNKPTVPPCTTAVAQLSTLKTPGSVALAENNSTSPSGTTTVAQSPTPESPGSTALAEKKPVSPCKASVSQPETTISPATGALVENKLASTDAISIDQSPAPNSPLTTSNKTVPGIPGDLNNSKLVETKIEATSVPTPPPATALSAEPLLSTAAGSLPSLPAVTTNTNKPPVNCDEKSGCIVPPGPNLPAEKSVEIVQSPSPLTETKQKTASAESTNTVIKKQINEPKKGKESKKKKK